MKALPLLIQTEGSTITIQGLSEDTEVAVYGVNGVMEGSAISVAGQAIIQTDMTDGDIAIVKIGETSVKVQMK